MDEKRKDLIVLTFTSLGSLYGAIWSVLYPYYCSYLHHKNSAVNMKNFYYNITALILGIPMGGFITPTMINIIGIRATFLVISLICFIQFYGLFYFDGVLSNILLGLTYGIQYTLNETATNIYLSLKYKKGVSYMKYIMSSRTIFVIFFGIIC